MLQRAIAVVAMLVLAGASPARAAPASEESEFVSGLGNQLLSLFEDPELSDAALRGELRAMFTAAFDVPAIARFVMGRHWRQATEEQRQEFLDLFRSYVANIYAERFSGYSGESFEVTRQTPLPDGDTLVSIEILRSDGPALPVGFRVRRGDEGFKIVDAAVEGVSLIVAKRDEFGSVIARDGIDGLLDILRRFDGENHAQAASAAMMRTTPAPVQNGASAAGRHR